MISFLTSWIHLAQSSYVLPWFFSLLVPSYISCFLLFLLQCLSFFPFYFLCLFCLWFSTSLEVGSAEMLDLFMRLISPSFYPRAWYMLILRSKMFLLFLPLLDFPCWISCVKRPCSGSQLGFAGWPLAIFPFVSLSHLPYIYCHSTPVEVCRSLLPSRAVAGEECVVLHIVSSGLDVLRPPPIRPNTTAVFISLSLYLFIWCHNS
jgi:hypothetical protein